MPRQLGFLLAGLDDSQDAQLSLAVDDWAEHVPRHFARPNAQRGRRGDQPVQELVIVVRQHDQSRKGAAFLALVTEGGRDAADDRLVQIRVAIHNDAVLAAHLAHNFFEIGLAGRRAAGSFPNPQPDFFGPGEGDEIHSRMRHQMRADFSARARQQIHHAGRQPCFDEQPHQPRAEDGRLVRWLHNHRVSRHDRRRGHAGENRQREIPRRDDHAHAPRPPLLKVRFARDGLRALRPAQLPHHGGVEVAKINRLSHVRVRLGPVLAGLEDFQGAEGGLVAAHQLRHLFQTARTFISRDAGPARLRRSRRCQRPLRFLNAGLRRVTNHLVLIRRIQRRKPVAS